MISLTNALAAEMALLVKCMPCKNKNLSLSPQKLHEDPSTATLTYHSNAGYVCRDSMVWKGVCASWLSDLVELLISGLHAHGSALVPAHKHTSTYTPTLTCKDIWAYMCMLQIYEYTQTYNNTLSCFMQFHILPLCPKIAVYNSVRGT